jgi:hypothetical protein
VIVWDLGGTITHFDPAARLTALALASGLPEATIHARVWSSGLDHAHPGTGIRDITLNNGLVYTGIAILIDGPAWWDSPAVEPNRPGVRSPPATKATTT